MRRIVHIVVTRRFAGVERYVCNVAHEAASRGHDVAVVGGHPRQMVEALGPGVLWKPGATAREAIRSIVSLGRRDVCHAHMTAAEAIAIGTRPAHRGVVVSTRHFAATRGTSRLGRVAAPLIAVGINREFAIGAFVATHLERPPAAILLSGVSSSPCLWAGENRVVLVLQRLDLEKDTLTALRAWKLSGFADAGWSLRIVGEGSERRTLEKWARDEALAAVTFTGWTADVSAEMRYAGILLAVAPAEPLGLAVLEAMASGVPVVASAAGGHCETIGLVDHAPLFPAGDGAAAAAALRSLLPATKRETLSAEGRRVVAERFTIERHVDRLLEQYEIAMSPAVARRGQEAGTGWL